LQHNFEDPFSLCVSINWTDGGIVRIDDVNPSSPQGILHSVLTGRMLLQLRQYEHKGRGLTELTSISAPLEFVRNPIASAGDDVEHF
jgi:hypothetical protein